jgi:hypothetical protein
VSLESLLKLDGVSEWYMRIPGAFLESEIVLKYTFFFFKDRAGEEKTKSINEWMSH